MSLPGQSKEAEIADRQSALGIVGLSVGLFLLLGMTAVGLVAILVYLPGRLWGVPLWATIPFAIAVCGTWLFLWWKLPMVVYGVFRKS